ncbi:MAG: recombination regulator RecX [Azoarcus sp.]|jgi:regulatory protein|nr:recombination regulator RecX [Azoarcus sp.]
MAEPSLRERALRYLARRDHSRAELARKLAPHGSPEEIDRLLDRMSELALQSDARYAEAWVRSHAARFGRDRLRGELARRGVERELIESTLDAQDMDTEIGRARALWQARFHGEPPADAREWARQARFLQTRGFAADLIRKLLKDAPDESA